MIGEDVFAKVHSEGEQVQERDACAMHDIIGNLIVGLTILKRPREGHDAVMLVRKVIIHWGGSNPYQVDPHGAHQFYDGREVC